MIDIDPFTRAVVQTALEATAEEMFAVLRKTAMSPIIYEVLDVGTGVMDANGALVSSGAGIPGFVGVLDKAVGAIVKRYGESVVGGDIFISNDPNHGSVTHLNDVVIAEPVFHQGERIAWVASIAHWSDIGGKTPGSMATDVTEIVAEGLRLPMLRLFAGGVRNEALYDVISANSRMPEVVYGDLSAQVSAGHRGAKVVRALAKRHGTTTLAAVIESNYYEAKARALSGLATLPQGIFTIDAPQDDGTVWPITLVITRDRFTVDLRDTPEQTPGPFNTSRDGSIVVCQMLFKSLTDPALFANAGSFAPLDVLTTPGTIFHAGPTAPQGYYFETRIRLFDALLQLMAKAMPGRLPAGHFASIFGTVIAGKHADTGHRYTLVEPQMGGWGATADRPGVDAMFSTSHGDTFNHPVEIAEARYGLDVLERSLIDRPEWAGAHDGGRGLRTRYQLRDDARLSVGYSHGQVAVWDVDAPGSGGCNALHVTKLDGHSTHHQFVSGLELESGDQVLIETANGGAHRFRSLNNDGCTGS